MEIIHLIIGAGVLAVVYGVVTSISVLSADTGNEKMQEISGAIQEGASAYLSRQYSTIALVGIVILGISYWLLISQWSHNTYHHKLLLIGHSIGALRKRSLHHVLITPFVS